MRRQDNLSIIREYKKHKSQERESSPRNAPESHTGGFLGLRNKGTAIILVKKLGKKSQKI